PRNGSTISTAGGARGRRGIHRSTVPIRLPGSTAWTGSRIAARRSPRELDSVKENSPGSMRSVESERLTTSTSNTSQSAHVRSNAAISVACSDSLCTQCWPWSQGGSTPRGTRSYMGIEAQPPASSARAPIVTVRMSGTSTGSGGAWRASPSAADVVLDRQRAGVGGRAERQLVLGGRTLRRSRRDVVLVARQRRRPDRLAERPDREPDFAAHGLVRRQPGRAQQRLGRVP